MMFRHLFLAFAVFLSWASISMAMELQNSKPTQQYACQRCQVLVKNCDKQEPCNWCLEESADLCSYSKKTSNRTTKRHYHAVPSDYCLQRVDSLNPLPPVLVRLMPLGSTTTAQKPPVQENEVSPQENLEPARKKCRIYPQATSCPREIELPEICWDERANVQIENTERKKRVRRNNAIKPSYPEMPPMPDIFISQDDYSYSAVTQPWAHDLDVSVLMPLIVESEANPRLAETVDRQGSSSREEEEEEGDNKEDSTDNDEIDVSLFFI